MPPLAHHLQYKVIVALQVSVVERPGSNVSAQGYFWSGLGSKSGIPQALSRPVKGGVCQHPILPCSPVEEKREVLTR